MINRLVVCLATAILAAPGSGLGEVARTLAAHGCSTIECFDQFVLGTTTDPAGVITAQIRTEFYDNPAAPVRTRPLLAQRQWKIESYKISCRTPGSYIQRADGETFEETDAEPPRRTEADKQLWQSICSPALSSTAPTPSNRREGESDRDHAAVAKTEAPQITGVVTRIVDAADLVINGQQLRLIGIDAGPREALPPFEKWVRSHAELKCELSQRRERYRCVTTTGVDVAEAALLNGAGQTSDDAAPIYRQREAEARKNRRGMWAKQ